ncbi:MAG: aminotransferase, partial [Chloroflexi bacterium]
MRTPVSPIAPFKLERYFARWEFSAPYLLCTSDIQGVPMKDLLALADVESCQLWDQLTLGYTETPGHPLLRAEIARL